MKLSEGLKLFDVLSYFIVNLVYGLGIRSTPEVQSPLNSSPSFFSILIRGFAIYLTLKVL
jgi:hypothetical protein